ncbi:nucleolar complex protein 4-like protein [Dinothrombium tinctorium]|uniref:Nucleolar complex protein 4-like protein n=1 Tax=Dinothrombium tinctorium TaxID=1965070 RepID=A0A3S3PUX8_9ACAR|nr:nucleolar complex protein 4-like protein [Dinothrombium tinctorium]
MRSKSVLLSEKLKTKKLFESVKDKCERIFETKQNVDHFEEVIALLEQNEESSIIAQRAIVKVFIRFLQAKEFTKNANKEFRDKLKHYYNSTKNELLRIIKSEQSDEAIQLCVLNLMKLLSNEGKYPIEDVKHSYFPFEFLKSIIAAILREDRDMSAIIAKFDEYVEYDDVKHSTLKSLLFLLKEKNGDTSDVTELFMHNVFNLLSSIRLPILGKIKRKRKGQKISSENESNLLCEPLDVELPKFKLEYEKAADLFASVWLQFISLKMPTKLYRNILMILDDHVMPHFRNPLSLSDFLINSFNVGGSVSILALSSLFILIQKCNLEYPDFYTQVYSLFEPNILHVKYRARFFFWSDVFLSSTHLPEYLVAAFIKRLSRMALVANVDALMIIIPFIVNLFVRHPNLSILMNRSDKQSVIDDPFDNEEKDPLKTNALESSLWEMKTLQSHWHPKVAKMASFINKPLPEKENDLSEILETYFEDVLNEELVKELNGDLIIDNKVKKTLLEFWK